MKDAVEKLSKDIRARDRKEHREKTKEERETERMVMGLAEEFEKEHYEQYYCYKCDIHGDDEIYDKEFFRHKYEEGH